MTSDKQRACWREYAAKRREKVLLNRLHNGNPPPTAQPKSKTIPKRKTQSKPKSQPKLVHTPSNNNQQNHVMSGMLALSNMFPYTYPQHTTSYYQYGSMNFDQSVSIAPTTQSSLSLNDETQVDSILSLPPINDDDVDSYEEVGLESLVIRKWAQKRPAVVKATDDMTNDLYYHPFNSEKGHCVTVDMPYSQNAAPNIASRKVMRDYFGRVDGGYTACYGSASGQCIGISARDFKVRPFTEPMDIISKYLLHTIRNHPKYKDDSNIVKELTNHHTHLTYFHKRMQMNEDMQLAYHNDILNTDDGEYIDSDNTQQMNSPTYSITVGDDRVLTFKEWRVGVGKEGASSKEKEQQITLGDGDLLILYPSDEKMMKRAGKRYPTKWKHGNVKTKKDQSDYLSLGLIFRNVCSKQQFDKTGRLLYDRSGKLIDSVEWWNSLSKAQQDMYNEREEVWNDFISSGEMKSAYLRLRKLCDGMKCRL